MRRFIGIDITGETLHPARENAEKAEAANVESHKAIIDALPLAVNRRESSTMMSDPCAVVFGRRTGNPTASRQSPILIHPGGKAKGGKLLVVYSPTCGAIIWTYNFPAREIRGEAVGPSPRHFSWASGTGVGPVCARCPRRLAPRPPRKSSLPGPGPRPGGSSFASRATRCSSS